AITRAKAISVFLNIWNSLQDANFIIIRVFHFAFSQICEEGRETSRSGRSRACSRRARSSPGCGQAVHNRGRRTKARGFDRPCALMLRRLKPWGARAGVLNMSLAMEQIVDVYVRLKDRYALEKLRTHREKLIANLNGLRSDLNFDSSLSLRSMAEDLAAIDAGFEQLDALARAQTGER
ncbi:MAG: hypothetical protein WA820_27400, partial [Bradyrhizobium sp.]